MKLFLNNLRITIKIIFSFLYKQYLRLFFKKIGKNSSFYPFIDFYQPTKIVINADCIVRKGVTIKGRSLNKIGVFIGKGVSIREFSNIDSYMGYIFIDDYCAIGHNCIIGGHGGVKIGKYTMIGGQSYIISSNHKFDNIDVPYMLQGENTKEIIIGNNVWIGANCTILPGVTIGDNCIIAAGSVVTKSFQTNLMIAGNPAKIINEINYDYNWIKRTF